MSKIAGRLRGLPVCAARGCREFADPRFYIHMPDGVVEMACDGHGNPGCTGHPCTCPPGQRVPGLTVQGILFGCLGLGHSQGYRSRWMVLRPVRQGFEPGVELCPVCGGQVQELFVVSSISDPRGVSVCSGPCALYLAVG